MSTQCEAWHARSHSQSYLSVSLAMLVERKMEYTLGSDVDVMTLSKNSIILDRRSGIHTSENIGCWPCHTRTPHTQQQ